MKIKKKYIILIILIFIILSGLLSVYFSYLHHYKGNEIINEWHSYDIFDENNCITLNKDPNKDFVILNLTDIQLSDIEDFFHRDIIRKEIDYLIKEAKPDLITLTGDQTWSNENLMSLKSIIRWLDSYKIPYAPIFGNHDYGNDYNSAVASLNYCCDLYENSKYCLFKRGPSNLDSLGNYVINIKENNKIIRTLYMIDTGYGDEVTDMQVEWIKWNAEGIKTINNDSYSPGICFMHKPIPMFEDSYYAYLIDQASANYEVLAESALFGVDDNGFYHVAKNVGIKNFVAGHQHTNSFSINYDDCTFTFSLKTGELSYYYDDGIINYNGGTVFTITSTDINIHNIYVDRNDFHIEGSVNQYSN